MHFRKLRHIFPLLVVSMITLGSIASAQNDRKSRRAARRAGADTTTVVQPLDSAEQARLDSIAVVQDSIFRADSVFRADSIALLKKSSINVPAFSTAADSIVEVFTDGKRLIYYYGDATVKYENLELKADYMEFDMNTGVLFARGTQDTLTGEWKGQPVMTQGGDTYEMEELKYNFNSRKSLIKNMTTHDSEAALHGENIKMFPDKSINITNGIYTVCDAPIPHYHLHMTMAKVITQPSRKTVFGPTQPVVEGVKIPIYIPFGFVPPNPKRATGMLMPTFGEETARGFYVRDAGMYFVIGDFFDLSLTGSYYTLGSYGFDINSRYKVNYKFNGNFSLTYSNDQTGEKGSADFFQTKNFAVKWSHSQDSKAHPGSTFSASVNFSSPSNSRYNSRSVSEALQNQISSSISYSHNWNGKMNLSINALHSQNSRDSSYTFTLPNLTFSVSTFYPFKQKHRVGKEKVYEKLSFGYSTSLQNKVSFKASEFGEPGFMDKFQNGMTHNFSIGLPSFSLFKYFNFNPSISYGQNWFFRKTEYEFNQETNSVEAVKGGQFQHFGITQTYSGGISMSTRLYGMYNFGKSHMIQAIRHVVSPSVSVSYRPELGTAANGWRTLYYTDNNGNDKEYSYNIYSGQMNSAPGKGQSASASFSVGNNIEAKVRDLADTTGLGSKKIKLIDNLNFSSGYNFMADSLRLNTISASMSTSLFGKVSISASASFDPYAIDGHGRRINTLSIIQNGLGQAVRLNSCSASMSYSISGKGATKGRDGSHLGSGGGAEGAAAYYHRVYYHPITGEYIPGGWMYYTNPNVPWSLSASYSFSMSKSYSYTNNALVENKKFNSTINMSGNIKLTPKMSVNASSGYDMMAMKITTSQFSATYDLHCFNISVSWVPTGTWKSYSFRICANASSLADILRFKKSSSYWDN